MDSRTDSFSWDLENLLVPENINDLFAIPQEGSVQKLSVQVESISQNRSLEQQQQQQQQQLVPPSENRTANVDQPSVDINLPVDIPRTATPQLYLLNNNSSKNISSLDSSATSSLSTKSLTEKYQERRQRNNLASRKSREKRKNKNQNILFEIEELNSSNEKLREKVNILEESLEKIKANLFASIVAKKTS